MTRRIFAAFSGNGLCWNGWIIVNPILNKITVDWIGNYHCFPEILTGSIPENPSENILVKSKDGCEFSFNSEGGYYIGLSEKYPIKITIINEE